MAHQLGDIREGVHEAVGKLNRVRGGEADAIDPVYCRHTGNQLGQVDLVAKLILTAIGIHVLAQQIYLTHALIGKVDDFIHNRFKGT